MGTSRDRQAFLNTRARRGTDFSGRGEQSKALRHKKLVARGSELVRRPRSLKRRETDFIQMFISRLFKSSGRGACS